MEILWKNPRIYPELLITYSGAYKHSGAQNKNRWACGRGFSWGDARSPCGQLQWIVVHLQVIGKLNASKVDEEWTKVGESQPMPLVQRRLTATNGDQRTDNK